MGRLERINQKAIDNTIALLRNGTSISTLAEYMKVSYSNMRKNVILWVNNDEEYREMLEKAKLNGLIDKNRKKRMYYDEFNERKERIKNLSYSEAFDERITNRSLQIVQRIKSVGSKDKIEIVLILNKICAILKNKKVYIKPSEIAFASAMIYYDGKRKADGNKITQEELEKIFDCSIVSARKLRNKFYEWIKELPDNDNVKLLIMSRVEQND